MVANADGAEEATFRAVEAVTRHRAVSVILARLNERDQQDLRQCYASRLWPGELAAHPAGQRWFAASSPAVRGYLHAHHTGFTPEAGEALLVLAEQISDAAELVAMRVEAWAFAERVVEGLFDRYARAERVVETEATPERHRPFDERGAPIVVERAKPRRLS
jgi:hypothetical protein